MAFLTVLGGSRPPDARTLAAFPVVGAAIGAVLAGVWLGAEELWNPAVAAALVVVADLAITGALHVDGVADSADGLLPHLPRERRLAVMSDPTIGAFALAVVPSVLLLRWVALAGDGVEPASLVGIWALSRTAAAVVPALVPYARAEGLASPFLAGARRGIALWGVPAAALVVWADGVPGAIGIVAAVGAAGAVAVVARRRIGGFTGDVLGATIVVFETVALLGAAA